MLIFFYSFTSGCRGSCGSSEDATRSSWIRRGRSRIPRCLRLMRCIIVRCHEGSLSGWSIRSIGWISERSGCSWNHSTFKTVKWWMAMCYSIPNKRNFCPNQKDGTSLSLQLANNHFNMNPFSYRACICYKSSQFSSNNVASNSVEIKKARKQNIQRKT